MALYESKLSGNESGELSLDLKYQNDRFGGRDAAYGETLWKCGDFGTDQADPISGVGYFSWPDQWTQIYAAAVGAETLDLIALKDPSRILRPDDDYFPFVKRSNGYSYVPLYDYYVLVCVDQYSSVLNDENIISPITRSQAFGTSSGPIVGVTKGSNNYAREVNGVGEFFDSLYGLLFRANFKQPFEYDDTAGDWIFKGSLIPLNKHNLWINFPALDCGLYEKYTFDDTEYFYRITQDVTCKEGKTYYKDSNGNVAVTEDTLFNDLQTGSLGVYYNYMTTRYTGNVGIVWKQNPQLFSSDNDNLHELSQYEAEPNAWYVMDNVYRYFFYSSQIKFSTAYKLNAAATSKNYVIPMAVVGVYGKGFTLRDSN